MGKWSRRAFIAAGLTAAGGLAVAVAISPGQRQRKLAGTVAGEGEHLLQVWVKVGTDGTVTALLPHQEMGQGTTTALPMMLADEMDADWNKVRYELAPADDAYANYALGQGFIVGADPLPSVLVEPVRGLFLIATQQMKLQITGGSSSVRATGLHGMRVAGAAARDMLVRAGAAKFGVDAASLSVENGEVRHAASGRSAGFGELAAAAAALDAPTNPTLKPRSQFRIMGTDRPRLDVREKVDGSARFGIDANPPGLRFAAVRAAPVFGGKVAKVDEAKVKGMPGVLQVVNLGDAVAVVADSYWRARKALEALPVEYDGGTASGVNSEAMYAQYGKSLDALAAGEGGETDRETGDVDAAFERAAAGTGKLVEAEYRVPFLAHAAMEPLNATAWLHDGKLELWTGNQNPLGFRAAAAAAAGLEIEQVTVHPTFLGGGFGRRALPDYAEQAVKIAVAAKVPVKVVWSREEDIRQDRYRMASTSRFRAALDAEGNPVAWQNGYVDKHEPAEAPLIPYAIAAQRIRYIDSPVHVPFGPWRSVDHSQHGFNTESFIDEVAHAAGKDPYQFRRALLAHLPRHLAVLDAAAKQGNWGAPLPKGWGRGIAFQDSFGTLVAQVVEVEVNAEGKVRAHRVVCAVDCGFAVHPDGVRAQMESGTIYGLTAALHGEITIANGAVVQGNFHDYEMVRMDEAPRIETVIINSDGPMGGAGEPGTPAIAPALANAVFAATGTRMRELPVKKYDLKFRINESARADGASATGSG